MPFRDGRGEILRQGCGTFRNGAIDRRRSDHGIEEVID
jgi:hypothetical protein